MPEVFNPIITHLYANQDGTPKEVTKYNNSTISEINVDNVQYDFGKSADETVSGALLVNTIKQPIKSVTFYGKTDSNGVSSTNPIVEIDGLNVFDSHDVLEVQTSSYTNAITGNNLQRLKNTLLKMKASGGSFRYNITPSSEPYPGQTNLGQFRLYAGGTQVAIISKGASYQITQDIKSVTSATLYGVSGGEENTFSNASFNLSDASVNHKYEPYKTAQIIQAKTLNVYNASTIEQNKAINGSDGTTSSNNQRDVTDYICVNGASYISMNYGASYAFYDATKTYISGESKSITTFRSYAVPSNAVYVRIDNVKDTVAGNDIMMVLGNYTRETLPAYEPFKDYSILRSNGNVVDELTVSNDGTGTHTKRIDNDGTVLADPVITSLTQSEVESILGGAFTNAPYTTILAYDEIGSQQTADVTIWEQR